MAKIFVITGPSGVGKGSVLEELTKESLPLYWAKTLTTRAPTEEDKKTTRRLFVSEKKFKELLKKDGLIEYISFVGHLYGTPKSELLRAFKLNKHPLFDVDPEGAKQAKKLFSNTKVIFLTARLADIKKRMLKRKRDTAPDIYKRLAIAESVLRSFEDYDIKVENRENKLDKAVEEIKQFIIEQLKEPIKVLAFGTFDDFHPGHIFFLRQAKKLGDKLIVVIARQASARLFKGREPKQSEKTRLKAVVASGIADKVVLEDEKDYFRVVYENSPDILALGYDQKPIHTKMFQSLEKMKLMGIKIIRIKPFEPTIYHSSLINES